MSKELAAAAKARGNTAFTAGDFETAVKAFSEAIENDPTDAVFYSNRSGAYASLKQFDQALQDANKCVELKPEFIKGYSRQGVAHFGLNQLAEAKAAYETGLKRDASNAALIDGLKDVEAKSRAASRPAGDAGLGGMFANPWAKLNANPETREYMKDPSFVSAIQQLQSNPSNIGGMLNDPRLSKALGVIMGIDFTTMGGGAAGGFPGAGAAGSAPPRSQSGGVQVDDDEDMDSDDDDGASGVVKDEKASTGARKFKQTAEMTPEEAKAAREATFPAGAKIPEPTKVLTEEERKEQEAKKAEEEKAKAEKAEKAKVRAEADKAKEQGNAAYKKRDFPTAITHYTEAIRIDPSNIVYYNNLSAVHMEQKAYDEAISACNSGVEQGKQHLASYTDVAKAYARIGAAYQAKGDLKQAEEYYNKSLLEDYNDKTKTALKKLQEELKRTAEAAYIDPVKSEEHKAKGNELFNALKFVDAIAEYSEAIKRDPTNYKVYSNRAACYQKLMEWNRALADCDKCLSYDSKFVKAYIRKGKIQHVLKQYHKALSTFDAALAIEPSNTEVMEAKRATMIAIQSTDADPERAKQAMQDPEIQAILRDPTISKVLADLQNNPSAGQAAMRDPDIRSKIEKLIAAGVLGVK